MYILGLETPTTFSNVHHHHVCQIERNVLFLCISKEINGGGVLIEMSLKTFLVCPFPMPTTQCKKDLVPNSWGTNPTFSMSRLCPMI
jgi:hypothetical protein